MDIIEATDGLKEIEETTTNAKKIGDEEEELASQGKENQLLKKEKQKTQLLEEKIGLLEEKIELLQALNFMISGVTSQVCRSYADVQNTG